MDRCADVESELKYCVDAEPANRSWYQALADCKRYGGELVALKWSEFELKRQLNDIHELVRKYKVNISAGVFMGNRSCLIASVSGNSHSIGWIECTRVFQSVPLICQRRVWTNNLSTNTVFYLYDYIGIIILIGTICALFMLPMMVLVVLICVLCIKRAHRSVTAPESDTNYEREHTFELYASIPPLAASSYESPTHGVPNKSESPTYDYAVGDFLATTPPVSGT